MNEDDHEDDNTPIERPLLRSDINEVREVIHRMDSMLVAWYEENKEWREQSNALVVRVARIETRLWLPTLISSLLALLALLARFA